MYFLARSDQRFKRAAHLGPGVCFHRLNDSRVEHARIDRQLRKGLQRAGDPRHILMQHETRRVEEIFLVFARHHVFGVQILKGHIIGKPFVARPFQLLVVENIHGRAESHQRVHRLEGVRLQVDDSFTRGRGEALIIVHRVAEGHPAVARDPEMRKQDRRQPIGLAEFDCVHQTLSSLFVECRYRRRLAPHAHVGTHCLQRDTASIAFKPKASAPV